MICPPCAEHVDGEMDLHRWHPTGRLRPLGHPADTCRDAAIQPGGCGCQHRAAAGSATPDQGGTTP